jgi:hypothetical protein
MIPTRKPGFRLYVFTRYGCHYCERAKPVVEKFKQAHPEGTVLLTTREEVIGFTPKGTPAYLFIADAGGKPFAHEGLLTLDDMEVALAQVCPVVSEDDEDHPPKGRKAKVGSDEEEEE